MCQNKELKDFQNYSVKFANEKLFEIKTKISNILNDKENFCSNNDYEEIHKAIKGMLAIHGEDSYGYISAAETILTDTEAWTGNNDFEIKTIPLKLIQRLVCVANTLFSFRATDSLMTTYEVQLD